MSVLQGIGDIRNRVIKHFQRRPSFEDTILKMIDPAMFEAQRKNKIERAAKQAEFEKRFITVGMPAYLTPPVANAAKVGLSVVEIEPMIVSEILPTIVALQSLPVEKIILPKVVETPEILPAIVVLKIEPVETIIGQPSEKSDLSGDSIPIPEPALNRKKKERKKKKKGPCDTSDQNASDGSDCGGRAASVRPGGREGGLAYYAVGQGLKNAARKTLGIPKMKLEAAKQKRG